MTADCIAEITENEKIDLIIMATKGARGFGEIWGTTSAKIVKCVNIPVMILPNDSTLVGIKKIRLACDYSEQIDCRKLSFLVEVAESLKYDINVFTLNREEKKLTRNELKNKEHIENQLQNIQTSFSFFFNSNVEEGVIDYCRNNELGIIAIAPKSYSYVERLFHESLTQNMAFKSPIPLLILK